MIQTDMGWPRDHIVSNLVDYDFLMVDVQAVLDSLAPFETEVRTTDACNLPTSIMRRNQTNTWSAGR